MFSIILLNREGSDAYIDVESLEEVKEKIQFIYEPAAIKNVDSDQIVAMWINYDYEAQVYEEQEGNHWIWLH